MDTQPFKFLLHGIDTLQCAYFLAPTGMPSSIDFKRLAEIKESIRQSKNKNPVALVLAGKEFLLQPYGSASGFPFVLETADYKIECGEYNKPNFYVTFRSQALWRESAYLLHEKFMKWASAAGFAPYRDEALSRVDFSFDYQLPVVDFTADYFKSRSSKDSQYRENGVVQTFAFGKGDIVLRVYDKVAEIEQQSSKVWFFILWEECENVWRIEWQVRKPILKRFDIYTFADLKAQQGDLLRYLATEHDTLRVPNSDANESRWPLHPLWQDLQTQIANLNSLGIYRVIGQPSALDEKMQRMAISMFGYLKRIAAVECVKKNKKMVDAAAAFKIMEPMLHNLYEPLSWQVDVEKRINEIKCGQW